MKQNLEKLAELLVLVEPRDLPGLAEVHTLFEQVQAEAADASQAWPANVSKASAELVQAIILDEVEDSLASLEAVAASVTALQQLILEGRDRSELTLAPIIAAAVGDVEEPAAACDSGNQTDGQPVSEPEPMPGMGAAGSASDATQEVEASDEAGTVPLAGDRASADGMPLTGDPELTSEFIAEANEHLDNADGYLLTIESNPDDHDAINALFRAFHTIKGVSGFLDLTDIQHLAHQTENLLDAARQGKLRLEGDRLDVVFDATDVMKHLVGYVTEALSTGGNLMRHPRQEELIGRLDALLNGTAAAAKTPVTDAPAEPDPTSTPAIEPAATPSPSTDAEAKEPEPAAPARAGIALRETVKVDSTRLDAMIDAIGELVIAEAMVTQSPELRHLADDGIDSRLSHLSKITRELQEMATSLRMVPIRATFQRMARLARDTAKKLDKRIEFVTNGEEVELDKTVVDQIGDPLVHMIRNAVDHGIENDASQRTEAGKSPTGRVELRAFHRGGSIYIEIADDGGGLDRDRILAKALERGLIREDEKLTDSEVYQLIMEPGFSTAKALSDVSGRGVGMDVVKRNIQKMRGQVEISSTPGEGTTFSIRLPLTLAIIDGMVVRVGPWRYVLPLLSITRMLRPDENHVPTVFGQAEMLKEDDGLIPLYRVHELFNVAEAQTDPRQASVVVVEHEGKKIGLMIDELLGQQQIVIKSLGASLRGVPGVAGGAIMPDGKVGLILDLDGLIRLAGNMSPERAAA